ncbi:MAG: hypothetical protein ACREVR_15000 [Burkholderiales bacterium]
MRVEVHQIPEGLKATDIAHDPEVVAAYLGGEAARPARARRRPDRLTR